LDISQLVKAVPNLIISYPEYVIGFIAVIFGLPHGVGPSNAYLPFGSGLLTLGLARMRFMDVGTFKFWKAYRPFLAGIAWSIICWFFCRWWLLDVHFAHPWVRGFFRY
jgi:hypothetical protein